MIDDIYAMLDAHLDRVTGASMGTESLAMLVALFNAGGRLLIGKVAVLRGAYLCNL